MRLLFYQSDIEIIFHKHLFIARNEELGQTAIKELEKLNIKAHFHQLDIDNQESIDRFAKYLKEKHGGLDVLINNAAIAFKVNFFRIEEILFKIKHYLYWYFKNADPAPFSVQARETLRINYTGTLNVCNALFPLLRPHARVVNVSSRAGLLRVVKDESIKQRLLSNDLKVDELNNILSNFVEWAPKNTINYLGFFLILQISRKIGPKR